MNAKKLVSLALTLVMVFACLALAVTAEESSVTLDVTTYEASAEQKYVFKSSSSGTYETVYKINVSWNIPDLELTYDSDNSWNDESLTWESTNQTDLYVSGGTNPTFTFDNRGTKPVLAILEFTQSDDLAADSVSVSFENNNGLVNTVVTSGTHAVDNTVDHTLTITGTVSVDLTKFNGTVATSGSKLGTYNISLGAPND